MKVADRRLQGAEDNNSTNPKGSNRDRGSNRPDSELLSGNSTFYVVWVVAEMCVMRSAHGEMRMMYVLVGKSQVRRSL
jgi:hypothetical protein